MVGAREKRARRGVVKFLSAPRYLAFWDVGLRGYLPGGGEDASFVTRCGSRNGAFADLCATTGLRLEEANSLLACELPEIDTSDGVTCRSCANGSGTSTGSAAGAARASPPSHAAWRPGTAGISTQPTT